MHDTFSLSLWGLACSSIVVCINHLSGVDFFPKYQSLLWVHAFQDLCPVSVQQLLHFLVVFVVVYPLP